MKQSISHWPPLMNEDTGAKPYADISKKELHTIIEALSDHINGKSLEKYTVLDFWWMICLCIRIMNENICMREEECFEFFEWLYNEGYRTRESIVDVMEKLKEKCTKHKEEIEEMVYVERLSYYNAFFEGSDVRRITAENYINRIRDTLHDSNTATV